jgi:hypothetical protein
MQTLAPVRGYDAEKGRVKGVAKAMACGCAPNGEAAGA